jgi:hypothetical protein
MEITPAGTFGVPPGRSYGADFNSEYERHVQKATGCLEGQEYHVPYEKPIEGKRSGVWFDARQIRVIDGRAIEFLIDAKGNCDQFVGKNGRCTRAACSRSSCLTA